MSLKSKLFNLAKQAKDHYLEFCEKGRNDWKNADCTVSDKVKDGMKYRFAIFPSTASRIEYAVEHQTKVLRDEIRDLKEALKSKEKVGS